MGRSFNHQKSKITEPQIFKHHANNFAALFQFAQHTAYRRGLLKLSFTRKIEVPLPI